MVDDVAEVQIRPATTEDALPIAQVHIESRRHAYSGVVSEEYLAGLDPEKRATGWRRTIEEAPEQGVRVWVAEDDVEGGVVGFASLGPSRDEDADRDALEIYTIYLLPDAWGRGVARRLLRTLLEEVPPNATVSLWVLAANERAQHFYRRNGFVADGVERLEELGDARYREVRWVRG